MLPLDRRILAGLIVASAASGALVQIFALPPVKVIGWLPATRGLYQMLGVPVSDRGLTNVRIHSGDARDLLVALPDQSLDRIELLYPDPWPKRRHHKRRIVSDEFLAAAARVLKPGCEFRFATDIDDYCAWTLAHFRRSKEFSWLAANPKDWLTPWEGWAPTRYEKKARREGRASAYLTFVRT